MKKSREFKIGEWLAIVLVIIPLIVAGPLLVIWALNTLFPVLAIPYTVWTWLAVVVLGGFWKARVKLDK